MNDPARPEISDTLVAVCLLAFSASLGLWSWIVRRAVRRESIVPYTPRRPVPWQALDLVLIFVFHVLVAGAVVELDRFFFPDAAMPAAKPAEAAKPSTEHDVLVLLRGERSLTALALCLAAAVVVAPITEEMFFRLLLQGWLEKAERQWRGQFWFSRGLLRGSFPVLGSSLAFALLHSRRAGMPLGPQVLFHILLCSTIVKLATMTFAFVLLRLRTGATCVDLGIRRSDLARDVGLGLGAALAVVPWVYVLQLSLAHVLPASISPDPFTLVPFAMVLGLLYYRTHRIVPSIVLHMALNATSLALAWTVLK
jgi:membrane protease YdiL (CAAX protease family)